MKPGYRTSEHAATWAVIVLSAVAMYRGHGDMNALASVVAPALASAAYSASRGRVKAPLDLPTDDADVARLLGRMFRGRVAK